MVKPAGKRAVVKHLVERFEIGARRACGLVKLQRSVWYYRSRRRDDRAVRQRIREIAQARPRFGYLRIHVLLRREGWRDGKNRVYRIYREEGLMVRTQRRRKSASHLRVIAPKPSRRNEHWSMDFVADRLLDGRRFRALTVVDKFTRYVPVIEADFSLNAHKVIAALDRVARWRGYPQLITVDNGSELQSKLMDAWAYQHGIKLDFIRPGKPVENCYIESFNGRLRDECLNAHVFLPLADARDKIEAWRKDYTEQRPHGPLGQITPAEF